MVRLRTWFPFCAFAAVVAGAASRRWEAAVAVVALFLAAFALMHVARRCPVRCRAAPRDAVT